MATSWKPPLVDSAMTVPPKRWWREIEGAVWSHVALVTTTATSRMNLEVLPDVTGKKYPNLKLIPTI
jgi:hypothetical protein